MPASAPSIFWLLALIIGPALSIYDAGKYQLRPKIMAEAAGLGIVGAFLGGHLFVLLQASISGMEGILFPVTVFSGGEGFFGGFIGAGLVVGAALGLKKISFLRYADVAAPAVALSYAVARIGCFFNGCCFGGNSHVPWAVKYPKNSLAFMSQWIDGSISASAVHSLPVHPVQVYHAGMGLLIFIILKSRRSSRPGGQLALGMGIYGVLRFWIQFFRGDRVPIVADFDVNQIFSLLFILVAFFLGHRYQSDTSHIQGRF